MTGSPAVDDHPIYHRPAEILQYLIRINTTNPPGNEAACINYINNLLAWAGIPTFILAVEPSRPNLVARLPGRGDAPPLLMYGHIDVVTTANQKWRVDPFAGIELDGYIWGRGAMDMKGGIAMMMSAIMRAAFEGPVPAGDIVFAILCDEENGSAYGAEYLVKNHSDTFKDIRYAIGEFGGYATYINRRRFYPIMVTEKQGCGMVATIQGPGGHGAWPVRGGIMAKVSRFLQNLERRLPVHITPVAKEQVRVTAEGLPAPLKQVFMQLLIPGLTNSVLDLLGSQARMFDPILHNTAAATGIHGGEGFNMMPGQVVINLDCRLLPGFTPDDLVTELRHVVGSDIDLAVTHFSPGPTEPNMGLYETLAAILREADPGGVPTPMLFPAVTDARLFSKLGIQTYGFTPMKLPPDVECDKLFHAANERIPVEALDFGAQAIYKLLQRFGN